MRAQSAKPVRSSSFQASGVGRRAAAPAMAANQGETSRVQARPTSPRVPRPTTAWEGNRPANASASSGTANPWAKVGPSSEWFS